MTWVSSFPETLSFLEQQEGPVRFCPIVKCVATPLASIYDVINNRAPTSNFPPSWKVAASLISSDAPTGGQEVNKKAGKLDDVMEPCLFPSSK